jgi:hypothetical protein
MTLSATLGEFVDELYAGQERITREDVHRRAVAAELPADDMAAVDRLPEGEYAQDELSEALQLIAEPSSSALSIDEPTA